MTEPEHIVTQEELLARAEREAGRHVGQLAGSCFCNVCVLLEATHDLRAQLTTARERVAEMERNAAGEAGLLAACRSQRVQDALTMQKLCDEALRFRSAGLEAVQRAEQAEARIAQLEVLISPHDLPPTADRSAPRPHKGSCAKSQCCQRPDDCKWGGSGGCGRENELCSCAP